MNQIETAIKIIKPIIEETAEQFVMADLTDASVLDELSGTFAALSDSLDRQYPRYAAAARNAGNLLREGAHGAQGLADADLHAVERTISALQSLCNRNPQEIPPDLPEGAGLNTAPAEDRFAMAAGVDQEILDEYLIHQEAVVSEIEDLVLSFEQHPDAGILKELKRLLHTAKGEAGVVGLGAIEKVCHRVEDYIDDEEKTLQADLLLEFKDWFEQTVIAVKSRMPIPSADNLMEALGQNRATAEIVDGGVSRGAEKQTETHGGNEDFSELLSPLMIEDPETTSDFISEAHEHFELSDENLLTLENDPENEEAIASIFRAFHTIKGVTSFLGLPPISELAHIAENLLDEVRRKRIKFEGIVVDATFNALDLLKKMTRQLQVALESGAMFVPDPELPAVFLQLRRALSPGGATAATAAFETKGNPETPAGGFAETAREPVTPREKMAGIPGGNPPQAGTAVKQTMKIDADRIDLLLETIGELVIIESIVSQEAVLGRGGESRDLERNLGQLTKITRSLQDMSMSMRLIPIDNTFRKMGRLVRDLAKKSGKQIELIMEGKETELDKGMVEKLGDPLVHMIRNAVDHGIEATPAERRAVGKDPVGRIVLKAYHQGGNIHIDIRDDGRGLDKDGIIAKAIDRGLITGAGIMTDEEIYGLIFESGFSTAKQVTDISGRGVGMDVVRSNIEGMRGNVRISSAKGQGTTFTLVLPLTMAIIDGMIVRVGAERYILPLLSIIESFQPVGGMIATISGRGETIPFRNRLLPMFRLDRLFNITGAQTDPTRALVVVLEDAGRYVAILVDELLGQNQTVIKNLGEGLKEVEGIAGASIMPDGAPGLIIDVNGLLRLAVA